MSRDYKETKAPGGKNTLKPVLLGFLVGLLAGVGASLAVAIYIKTIPSPFITRGGQEAAAAAKPDQPAVAQPEPGRPDDKTAKAGDKQRFDFYKILPGTEEPVTDQAPKKPQQQGQPSGPPAQMKPAQGQAAQSPPASEQIEARAKDSYFLQAGSFQNPADADDLKAKLALLGVEATVQSIPVQDKGVWHRVRIGPYTNLDDVGPVRASLKQSGIDTTLIKLKGPSAAN